MNESVPSTPSSRPAPSSAELQKITYPHTRWSLRIDRMVTRIGNAISWVWLMVLLVIVVNVVSRYVFDRGRIEFEEIQWHLYAVGFLFAIPYGLTLDAHVRVDVLHERWPPRIQAWIELYGLLLLFAPFVALVLIYTVPFVSYSFATGEISQAPGGLPYRWLIKSALFFAFALLALAGWARLLRVCAYLFRNGTLRNGTVRNEAR